MAGIYSNPRDIVCPGCGRGPLVLGHDGATCGECGTEVIIKRPPLVIEIEMIIRPFGKLRDFTKTHIHDEIESAMRNLRFRLAMIGTYPDEPTNKHIKYTRYE